MKQNKSQIGLENRFLSDGLLLFQNASHSEHHEYMYVLEIISCTVMQI